MTLKCSRLKVTSSLPPSAPHSTRFSLPRPVPFDVECLYNVPRILLVAFAFDFVSYLFLSRSIPRENRFPMREESVLLLVPPGAPYPDDIISIAKTLSRALFLRRETSEFALRESQDTGVASGRRLSSSFSLSLCLITSSALCNRCTRSRNNGQCAFSCCSQEDRRIDESIACASR